MSEQQELTVRPEPPSTDMTREAQTKLLAFLGKYKGQVEKTLPKHLTPERVTRLIVGEINRIPKLLECSPMSVVNCVLHAASLGLEIRPRSAYLIPFKNKYGKSVCTLIIDYRGKIDLAKRSGLVEDIEARLVYAADEFDVTFGTNPALVHKPLQFRITKDSGLMERVTEEERGPVILGYAICWYKDGRRPHVEPMTFAEIEKIRAKSRAKDDGPWVTDWNQMARKTLVHRICNYIPQSPELAASQDIDDAVERDGILPEIIDVDPVDDKPLIEASLEEQNRVRDEKIAQARVEQAAKKEEQRLVRQTKKANGKPAATEVVKEVDALPDPLFEELRPGQQLYCKGVLYEVNEDTTAWSRVEQAKS